MERLVLRPQTEDEVSAAGYAVGGHGWAVIMPTDVGSRPDAGR